MSEESMEKPLIKFSRKHNLTDSENHDRFIESVRGSIRTITVEPIMAFFIIISCLHSYTMGQYIYFRVQKDYGIMPNDTLAHVCVPDANNTDKAATDLIQTINANYNTYIQLCSCVCTILTAPFYCVFSDRYGRKIMFIIPSVGVFLKSVVEVLVQVFDWPIYSFIFTEGLYGLFGGIAFVTGLSFSYIADITTQQARTKRIAIIGVMMGVGALCVSLIIGVWIKYDGYLPPYIFSTFVSGLCLFYTMFLLKEPPRMPDHKSKLIPPMEQFKRLFTIFIHRPKTQRALLIIMMIMFNFYYVSEMSNMALGNTYLMAYPICMNTVEMSVFGFLNILVINIGVVISVLIVSKYVSDLPLVVICLLSGLAFALQMAFSTTKLGVYIAAVSNVFSFSAFPFIRGYLSKRFKPHEQGALFGALALSETFSTAITKVVTIYVYGATFHIFHGIVYFFISGFSVIAMILTMRFIKDDENKSRVLETLCGTTKEKLVWSDQCDKVFKEMKEALTENPILVFPDFRKGFILDTDASFDTIGAVL